MIRLQMAFDETNRRRRRRRCRYCRAARFAFLDPLLICSENLYHWILFICNTRHQMHCPVNPSSSSIDDLVPCSRYSIGVLICNFSSSVANDPDGSSTSSLPPHLYPFRPTFLCLVKGTSSLNGSSSPISRDSSPRGGTLHRYTEASSSGKIHFHGVRSPHRWQG
jgi:hypothetical protein